MRVYRTVDKSGWKRGPWLDEPDKVQWIDGATDYDCLIVRAEVSGSLCGYVGVPPGHPAYKAHYDDVSGVSVHGGLTYGDFCWANEPRPPDHPAILLAREFYAAGKINADELEFLIGSVLSGEAFGICHLPEPGRPENVYWLGFDTGHAWDVMPAMEARMRELGHELPFFGSGFPRATYRDIEYVKAEVTSLAAQLAELAVSNGRAS